MLLRVRTSNQLSPLPERVSLTKRQNFGAASAAIQKNEQLLWHKSYLDTARELCQWDVVTEYARAADDCQLQVDALWRVPDWETLRLDVIPRALVRRFPSHLCPAFEISPPPMQSARLF